MPNKAKVKRIRERLEQVKARAAQENAQATDKGKGTSHDLAEEAAGLGLELAEMLEEEAN